MRPTTCGHRRMFVSPPNVCELHCDLSAVGRDDDESAPIYINTSDISSFFPHISDSLRIMTE